jgi:predicted DNA-binding ribbon-helix-helix protein
MRYGDLASNDVVSPNGRKAEIMKTAAITRSIALNGLETGVCLEDAFWGRLEEIAQERFVTLTQLVTAIDAERSQPSLSSAIRAHVLQHFSGRRGAISNR